ncbi:MAG TPA: hypothetical protein PKW21_15775 [Rhabdaerophilum sp.]|nr:hypothetical protein [Rhabdaerophilum sp.]
MSKTTLKLNGSTVVPVDTIRRIKPLSDDDRTRAGEKLSVDTSRFQSRVEFADGTSKLIAETIDELKGQGVGLVNVGADRFVPAINIRSAEAFTKADADKLAEKGFTLSKTFRSRVETTAGQVLSLATAEQIMQRRAKALDGAGEGPKPQTA